MHARTVISGFLLGLFLHIPAAAASFWDVPSGHGHATAIGYLEARGVAHGYGDRTFRPEQPISRAEFAAFLLRLRGTTLIGCGQWSVFPDVRPGAWYADVLCTARAQGMIQGYADGSARPDQPVTFAEAAKIMTAERAGTRDGAPWYRPYIEELASQRAIPLSVSGPEHVLSRAEMAEILWRVDARVTDLPTHTYATLVSGEISRDDAPEDDAIDMEAYFDYDDDDIDDLEDEDADDEGDVALEDLLLWDEAAMGIAQRRALSPPNIGALYASLAVAQRDAMVLMEETGVESPAAVHLVSAKVLCHFSSADCNGFLRAADADDDDFAEALADMILGELERRWQRDASAPLPTASWAGTLPADASAGQWDWWFDHDDLDLPDDPPLPGSRDEDDELDDVRRAVKRITPEELAAVHAWAGREGMESPAGIWMGRIGRLLRKEDASAARAAEVRSVAAMTMADAFIATWKTKFRHAIARPFVRDPSIVPLVATRNVPSYVSAHASVSRAVAIVLAEFYREEEEHLLADAEEAADTQVWAGIQYPVDTEDGADLGDDIAEEALDWHEDHRG